MKSIVVGIKRDKLHLKFDLEAWLPFGDSPLPTFGSYSMRNFCELQHLSDWREEPLETP